jgi:hypothetical protein
VAGLTQQANWRALCGVLQVLIAPHLDPLGDTSKRPKWRNMLRFDPLGKDSNGYRYVDMNSLWCLARCML